MKNDAQFSLKMSQKKEANREVKVIYCCKFIVFPWSHLCLAACTAFQDLGGNLQVVERFCRDSCQIRLLSLNSDWFEKLIKKSKAS